MTLALDASFSRRPDMIYDGEGARTLQWTQSRYLEQRLEVAPRFETNLTKLLTLRAKVGARAASFEDAAFDEDASIPAAVAAGELPLPADYGRGYTDAFERAELTFDTRRADKLQKTGVRLHGFVEHGTDVRGSPGSSWIKYGATAGGYLDVWKARVVSLTVTTELADPLKGVIPFPEEVVWGGNEPLSGILEGRLHGRSAAGATLAYAWPVWIWLDGTMRASVGNVFDAGYRDFDPKLLRFSSGIGVQSNGSPDHRLEILLGFATETFDQGAKVDSIRFVIGGTNGF
jgi:hypothetical protein